MRKFVTLWGLFFICSLLNAEDSIIISSRVNKKEIRENQTLILKLKIDSKGSSPPFLISPQFEDFYIISRLLSQKKEKIKNDVHQKIEITYILKPKKAGILKINSFSIKTPEKIYTTEPILIKVKPAAQKHKEEIVIPPGGVTI